MARYKVTVEFESEGLEHHYKTRTYHVDSLPEDLEDLYCDDLICEEPDDCWSATDVTVEDTHEPTYVPAVAGGYMHDRSKHWPKEGK